MSYLLDKKLQRKKYAYSTLCAVLLFIVFYFRNPVFSSLSVATHTVFYPVILLKDKVGSIFSEIAVAFRFKNNLITENETLKNKLLAQDSMLVAYSSVLDENIKLKEIFSRTNTENKILLGSILEKPNRSLYDTLILDIGSDDGIQEGDLVFALGDIPVGRIASVYGKTSKVVLFSNSGEKTEVVVGDKNAYMEIIGRGGGNFEMILPRDYVLQPGLNVTLPGISNYVVAKIETIISDPRDAFAKALLVSPVNIQELKFVEVKL